LPAALLKAEQISAATPLAIPSAESEVEPAAAFHASPLASFDGSVADPFELLSSASTANAEVATAEVAAAASLGAQQPPTAEVNFTPIGIMVASSAVTVVPEPSTVILLGGGALAIFWAARRRRG
jgi:hypothetical protein